MFNFFNIKEIYLSKISLRTALPLHFQRVHWHHQYAFKIMQACIFLIAIFINTSNANAIDLINGGVISDAISTPHEEDSYTFVANAGEGVQIRVADTSGGNFSPRVTVYRPDGSQLISGVGSTVAWIACSSPCVIDATGTYTVVVADGNQGGDQTGTYDIYFTLAPGANEGGELLNGWSFSGDQIDLGDLDSYTFFANAGEGVQIRVADTSGGNFSPRVTVYRPDGSQVTSSVGSTVAGITCPSGPCNIDATGIYTVVVADGNQGGNQTGTYTIGFTIDQPGGKDDLIADFPGAGLWVYRNDTAWDGAPLHGLSAAHLVTADLDNNGKDEVIADFGPGKGIWVYRNDSAWDPAPLHGLSATHIIAADMDNDGKDEVIADFGPGKGIWVYRNDSAWDPAPLHGLSATHIIAADMDNDGKDEVIVDFNLFGIWVYRNDTAWDAAPLRVLPATHLVAADMDYDGKDEVIVDFNLFGIWVYRNDTAWDAAPLRVLPATHLVAADMDNNGQDEIIVDFGPGIGIWVYRNDTAWDAAPLHGLPTSHIVAGDIDGS